MLGWTGPGLSCSARVQRLLRRACWVSTLGGPGVGVESGGGRAPGPLAVNVYTAGGPAAFRISLKWLQIHGDPEDKSLEGDCEVCAHTCTHVVSLSLPGDHCGCYQAIGKHPF